MAGVFMLAAAALFGLLPHVAAALLLDPPVAGFERPVLVAHAGDDSDRIFVVEQGGLVRVVHQGRIDAAPFLDARALLGSTSGEQGLLGLAFHPRFSANGRLFIAYTDKDANNAVAELIATRVQGEKHFRAASSTTARVILTVRDFASNHNGGHLVFGPDGKLWIGTGDGGGGGDPKKTAQDDDNLLGKMLVLDVDTTSAKQPAAPLVWAKGLRNPWRYDFDRVRGSLWIADVGQNEFEEVHHVRAPLAAGRRNFGWSIMEGSHCFPREKPCDRAGLDLPVFELSHDDGNCSITGGVVVPVGGALNRYAGAFLVGDYCSGRIWALTEKQGKVTGVLLGDTAMQISSFGVDAQGNVWVVDHQGSIRRIRGG